MSKQEQKKRAQMQAENTDKYTPPGKRATDIIRNIQKSTSEALTVDFLKLSEANIG